MTESTKERLQRAVLIVSAIAIVAFMFWDTGSEAEYDDGKIHVEFWHGVASSDDEPFIVSQFNAEQDSIVVHAVPIPWQEHEKKVLTAILSGEPPDVISLFVPVVRWASRMALRPLDDYIEESEFDTTEIFPALWDEVTWLDRTFALPVMTASFAFFYNKEAFREAGLDPDQPPTTWAEVQAYARQLDVYDDQGRLTRAGFLPGFSASHVGILGNVWIPAIQAWELGAEFLSDDGQTVVLTSPEMIRAAQWNVDYYQDRDLDVIGAFIGGLGTGEQSGFLVDKLGMVVLDMSFLDLIARHRPDLDFGVVEVPSFEGYPTASSTGSFWMGIPRGAKNPRAAWEFMKSTVSKERQLEEIASRDDHLFPANRLAAYDSTFITSDLAEVFVRQMDHSHSATVVPLVHGVFWREFAGALERSVHREQETRESFERAERTVQNALDRTGGYDRFVRSKMSFEDLQK